MGKILLPVGEDNFELLRRKGSYYIDKTGFISELLQDSFKVNLITRPRRFGKTLAMTMLQAFFDIRKDSRFLFCGLEIAGDDRLCSEWMNRWPVLFLTFKDVAGNGFRSSYHQLAFCISSLCVEHAYLMDSGKVDSDDRNSFARLKAGTAADTELRNSLFLLTRMMYMHYGKPVILLIDEYDVPLAKASEYGYYQEMLNVIRSIMSSSLKTNEFLQFAVITGCLRIAKESIFTGTNHFKVNSIAGNRYTDSFGFTPDEVEQLLSDAGFASRKEDVKNWYDGYRFGNQEIYCPWDVLNYVSDLESDPLMMPANYWKDTSHNDIIKCFIGRMGLEVNDKLERLLAGGCVKVKVNEDSDYTLFNTLKDTRPCEIGCGPEAATEEDFWSVLYLTGYLTAAKPGDCCGKPEPGEIYLKIPNEEVKIIFQDTIVEWFRKSVRSWDKNTLFSAVWNGEEEAVTREMTKLLRRTISYYDYNEAFYHAFLAGLFSGAGYQVESNKEHGEGRSDVIVKNYENGQIAVFEVKRSRKKEELQKDCEQALKQIDDRKYAEEFEEEYDCVLCYGIAFYRKQCRVLLREGL